MVSRFRPLDAELAFEERPYALGDTVNATVGLTPKMDVTVREARLELVWEGRWTSSSSISAAESTQSARHASFGGGSSIPQLSTRTTNVRRERYVHSNAVFLSDSGLKEGVRSTHGVRLHVQPQLPRQATGASQRDRAQATWSLVMTVDIVGSRDVRISKPIHIVSSQEATASRSKGSRLTPEQRRQNARRAAQARWAKARGGGPAQG